MKDLAALSADLTVWLKDSALPLWWNVGADHQRGGFEDRLGSDAKPVHAKRRARVHARQIYVYATVGEPGWDGLWRDAVEHGLYFFLTHHLRPDGLYRTLVSPVGEPLDETTWLYDQAFALFAMAQAARVLPERRAELMAKAHGLRRTLDGWRRSEGGFQEPPAQYFLQSNPHMHLFEAALAWAEVDENPAWNALADEVAELAMNRFIDANGQLHEFFSEGWNFVDVLDGRIVEPGHQSEWAWLMERWARLRSHEPAHKAAVRLFEAGKSGIDDNLGAALQQVLDDGSTLDGVVRLWPQTEWIKAALIFVDTEEAAKGVFGLKLYFDNRLAGLWWDKLRSDGQFVDEPAPASSFCHIICAILDLRNSVDSSV